MQRIYCNIINLPVGEGWTERASPPTNNQIIVICSGKKQQLAVDEQRRQKMKQESQKWEKSIWDTRYHCWAFWRCWGLINETSRKEGAHLMTPVLQLSSSKANFKCSDSSTGLKHWVLLALTDMQCWTVTHFYNHFLFKLEVWSFWGCLFFRSLLHHLLSH